MEPFVGGGGMFCAAYAAGLAGTGSVLSDLNPHIIKLYKDTQAGRGPDIHKQLESYHEVFLAEHADGGNGSVFYYALRALWREGQQGSAEFITLKQLAFNGLWRESKKSGFNVPCAKYKRFIFPDLKDFQAWEKALEGITLVHGSFVDLEVPDGALVYSDPPYAGTFQAYTEEGFNNEDQLALVRKCAEWSEAGFSALSNSDCPELGDQVASLWPKSKSESIEITHSVAAKGSSRVKKQEKLYFSA